jgi:iron(III) transport system substrate-binding protein
MFARFAAVALATAMSLAVAGPSYAQQTKLNIYTALENDQLRPFKEAIEKAVPEV